MKKSLTLLLTAIALAATTAAHALEVNATDARLRKGEPASVTVKFNKNPLKDVFAIELALEFDANAFRLERIEKGKTVSQFQLVENRNDGPGMAKVALIGLFPLNAESGDLLTLHFTARDQDVRARDDALTIAAVTFSSDQAALTPEKITQGSLILSR